MTIALRAAVRDDFPAIAGLLVQLYEVELAGALTGPADRQKQLLRFTLESKNNQGLYGRYVGSDGAGVVIATGVIERPDQVGYERAPEGTIRLSLALLGYRSTVRLLMTVARTTVDVRQPKVPDAMHIHSVVVDAAYRGRGVGHALMTQLEQKAAEQGYSAAYLQVLESNHAACRLYTQRGYKEIWATPGWARMLTWPSYILRKSL